MKSCIPYIWIGQECWELELSKDGQGKFENEDIDNL